MINGYDRLAARLENVQPTEDGFTARCPAHEDRQNSLSVSHGRDGRTLIHCHAGCPPSSVLKALDLRMGNLFAKQGTTKPTKGGLPSGTTNKRPLFKPLPGLTLKRYVEAKQLPEEFLRSVGVRERVKDGKPALRMEYRSADGAEAAVRWRIALAGDRFRWAAGAKPCLYGLWRLPETPPKSIWLVEGESDCQTLWFHGKHAVGLPGASQWREDRDARHFEDIKTIFCVVEADRGGEAMIERLSKSTLRDRVKLIDLDGAKDVSELHVQDPQQFYAGLFRAILRAKPLSGVLADRANEQAQDALKRCGDLAKQPDILTKFADAYRACGTIGEMRLAKVLYLALTSRFLDRPVSIAVKGASSGGKSVAVETALAFFPQEATYNLTGMSERALVYSEADFRHRHIVMFEAEGMAGDMQSYFIRTLLSEGRLLYEAAMKTDDGIKSVRLEKEGPTGLIVTTTKVKLHPENETRLFSLTIDDTPDQTRAVMQALANPARQRPDLEPWTALQTWLACAEHRVAIPYAPALAEQIKPYAIRLRRDFGQVLALIKAHAILHQANRSRDADGQIVATVDDYAAVRELVNEIISEGVDATVSEDTREIVEAVRKLLDDPKHHAGVTNSALEKELPIGKSTVSRRVKVALAAGYLVNEAEGTKGKRARLVIGEPMPKETGILPDPEVFQCSDRSMGGQEEKNFRNRPKRGLKFKGSEKIRLYPPPMKHPEQWNTFSTQPNKEKFR